MALATVVVTEGAVRLAEELTPCPLCWSIGFEVLTPE